MPATVKEVREFFNTPERKMDLPAMREEWLGKDAEGNVITDPTKVLTKEDKEQILAGLGDGSLTY